MTDSKAPTLDLQSDGKDNPNHVADAYADRLMDDLFGGIERALDGDVEALEAPPKAESAVEDAETPEKAELTLSFSEGGLPAVLLAEQSENEPVHVSNNLLTAASPVEETSPVPQKSWKQYLTTNRVLLGAAGLTALATAAVWLNQQQQLPIIVSVPTPTPAQAPATSANAEFLEYLRRSFDMITQNAGEAASASANGVPNVTNVLNLPPIGNNVLPPTAGVPVPNTGPLNVIERIYVPYQATPQVPPAPSTAPYTASQPAASNSPTTVAVAPAHTLIGVFELGDRSAAIFDIDGVTQRVYIGEQIGGSGWSVVSVANEEAVIRRNGEVRSIYIGQQF